MFIPRYSRWHLTTEMVNAVVDIVLIGRDVFLYLFIYLLDYGFIIYPYLCIVGEQGSTKLGITVNFLILYCT